MTDKQYFNLKNATWSNHIDINGNLTVTVDFNKKTTAPNLRVKDLQDFKSMYAQVCEHCEAIERQIPAVLELSKKKRFFLKKSQKSWYGNKNVSMEIFSSKNNTVVSNYSISGRYWKTIDRNQLENLGIFYSFDYGVPMRKHYNTSVSINSNIHETRVEVNGQKNPKRVGCLAKAVRLGLAWEDDEIKED
jgi:hypothetical protein